MHLHREILQLPIFESASQVIQKKNFSYFHFNSIWSARKIKLSTFHSIACFIGMPQITFTSYKSQFLCTRRVSNSQRWRAALHLLYFQRFDGSNAKWNGRCYIGYVLYVSLSFKLFATVFYYILYLWSEALIFLLICRLINKIK